MELDTQALTQLLAKKCELLLQLRQLGIRQAELIGAGDLGQLLNLLGVKQRVLANLQSTERQLDPFRLQSPEKRQWVNADARRRGAELAETCERLLAEVIQSEKLSEQQLVLRRDEAASQLHAVHHAAQARSAYSAQPPVHAMQVDLSTG
jgi:flagellar biosynthesis/type III secretory pathway chaperone